MGLPPGVLSWVAGAAGRPVRDAQRLPGGNRRQAWVIELETDPPRSLFLRYGEHADADAYSLRREAQVYRALQGTPVRLPALIADRGDGTALLFEHAPGDPRYRSVIDPAQRQSIADDLAGQLGLLHRLDPGRLRLGGLGPVAPVRVHTSRELATWGGIYQASGSPDPLIEYGLAWAEASIPEGPAPVVLCHGDAGPGNFLHRDGSLTALLDWELAHLGDPMEDLAWVSMRHVLEPLPDFGRFLGRYQQAAGWPADPGRIRYFRVLVQLRVAIIRHCDDRSAGRDSDSDVANSLVSRAVNRRLLLEALADAAGAELPAVTLPEAAVPDEDWLFDELLADLRDTVGPRVTGDRALAKLKSDARLVKYLRRVARYRDVYAAEDRAGLTAVLGAPPADHAAGLATLGQAIRAGEIDGADLRRYLAGVVARETSLMRDALGRLATRHLPPLEAGR